MRRSTASRAGSGTTPVANDACLLREHCAEVQYMCGSERLGAGGHEVHVAMSRAQWLLLIVGTIESNNIPQLSQTHGTSAGMQFASQ